jgi:hypothetical protein
VHDRLVDLEHREGDEPPDNQRADDAAALQLTDEFPEPGQAPSWISYQKGSYQT